MLVFPGDALMSMGLIDPTKQFDEPGQFKSVTGNVAQLELVADDARKQGLEIRWYYRGLGGRLGTVIGSEVIVTEIPPGHVQPFHIHSNLYESTLVFDGEIVAVESDTLTEQDCKEMSTFDLSRNGARTVHRHEMVVEEPGIKHTIANKTDDYATIITVQTAKMPLDAFPLDWKR